MSNGFGFLNYIECGAEPTPNGLPGNISDADSNEDGLERQDLWDDNVDYGHDMQSPNTSFGSPTLEFQHEPPAGHNSRHSMQQGLRKVKQYGLRKNVPRTVFKGSGYVDHDESGNYDPNDEVVAKKLPTKRKLAAKSGLSDERINDESENNGSEESEQLSSTQNGIIETEAPIVSSESVASEETPNSLNTGDTEVLPTKEKDSQNQKLPLSQKLAKDSNKTEDKHGELGGKDSVADTGGGMKIKKKGKKSPISQACSSCQSFSLVCSILDDPEQYPCTACCEEDLPCILPNPRTAKAREGTAAAIRNLKKKQKEQKEVAKSQKRRDKNKTKFLKKTGIRRPGDQKYKACAPCRAENKGRCSLKSNEDAGPCNRCNTKEFDCTFEDKLIKPRRTETVNGKGRRSSKSSASSGKNSAGAKFVDSQKRNAPGHRTSQKKDHIPAGMRRKEITTCFCHPISFNVNINIRPSLEDSLYTQVNLPSAETSSECLFHTTTIFGLFGFGERTFDVFEPKFPSPANPFAYIECSRGHASAGEDPTILCIECTFARQSILFCQTHNIRAIAGLGHPRDYDYTGAYKKLMEDQEIGREANSAGNVLWCSVCVAPAFYECCTPHHLIPGEVGCGLLLCDVCAAGLCGGTENLEGLLEEAAEEGVQSTNGGKMKVQERRSVNQQVTLDTLIDRARRDIFRYEDGVRADAGFLTSQGELKLWMESETTPDDDDEESAGEVDTNAENMEVTHAGWSGFCRQHGLSDKLDETFEEYALRMKLEMGELENQKQASTGPATNCDAQSSTVDENGWAF